MSEPPPSTRSLYSRAELRLVGTPGCVQAAGATRRARWTRCRRAAGSGTQRWAPSPRPRARSPRRRSRAARPPSPRARPATRTALQSLGTPTPVPPSVFSARSARATAFQVSCGGFYLTCCSMRAARLLPPRAGPTNPTALPAPGTPTPVPPLMFIIPNDKIPIYHKRQATVQLHTHMSMAQQSMQGSCPQAHSPRFRPPQELHLTASGAAIHLCIPQVEGSFSCLTA